MPLNNLSSCLSIIWLAALLVFAAPAFASDLPKNAKDHPLVTRFAGAEMIAYDVKDYDETSMPVKKIDDDDEMTPDMTLSLEGKITRIGYTIDFSKTTLEVMRNYKDALGASGFDTLFECTDATCGQSGGLGVGAYVVSSGKVMPSSFTDTSFNEKNRYLLVHREGAGENVYVLVYVMNDNSNKKTLAYIQVVEIKPMQTGQVEVLSADQMVSSLDRTGKVAVYGVYFDNAKAQIKPDSKAALDAMVKTLQQKPGMKVYIVGHTDNNGTLAGNLLLSQQRADAVVSALTASGINAGRLTAKGVASLSPVALNTDDAGRAKNRRVELVVQ